MARAPGKIVVHYRSKSAAMGTLDAFFAMRCFGAISPEDIYATLECDEVIAASHPSGAASIVVVDPNIGFPSEATRRAAVEVDRRTNDHTRASVVVILGDGFWASAVRGILTTMRSLSRASYPRKVCRTEEEGVTWTIETMGESLPKYRPALLAALEELKPGRMERRFSLKP